jgi:PAS domain S-box-containing protein
MKPSRLRLTLGAWLAFAFSALSLLLALIVTAMVERTASERIGSGIGANLAELANQTATRLDRGIFERWREIELLANRLGPDDDWDRVQRELTALQSSYRYYAWIGVADPGGVVRAASRGMRVGENVAERPWFRRALAGQHLGDVHEVAPLAALLGPAAGGEPPRYFDVAFPLRGGGGPVGIVGAHISWEWARDLRAAIFRPIGRKLEVDPLILATDGLVLLGPVALQGRQLKLESARLAQAGQPGFYVEDWPDGKRYLVGFSRSKGHERSPGLGWTVLVRQEFDDAYAPVRELQRVVLGSGIAIALLFSVLGWLVARAITAPLLDLTRSARALETGAPTEVPRSEAYTEVAVLGATLDSLLGNLRRNEQALRELNAGLERRVAERTAELQAALERAQASEQRVGTILATAQDPFIGMDLQGRITDWNAQAEVVFGWRREEILGRLAGETLLPRRFAGTLEAALQGFLATGTAGILHQPIERVMIDRHGREIPVEVKVGLVQAGTQRFFGAFVHDISQRKQVERMKDEFVSTVSHELRTPLTAIYGSLDLLASGMGGELPEDARQLLAISHESTERLIRLINDMLDMEKIASGKIEYRMQRQPLAPLVERALRDTQAFAEGLGVRLRLVEAAGGDVEADADRIIQVCVNLLSNGAKYSPEGGTVEVFVQARGATMRVGVVDRGPGVPEEFRPRVFERFAQAIAHDRRAQGGTGLGLSICRAIVEAHGGAIGFDSEPGVRTEFWFTLPKAGGPGAAPAP